jgi:hypothetical protein
MALCKEQETDVGQSATNSPSKPLSCLTLPDAIVCPLDLISLLHRSPLPSSSLHLFAAAHESWAVSGMPTATSNATTQPHAQGYSSDAASQAQAAEMSVILCTAGCE